ncbi:hypothetical protein CPB83DRAFT_850588 [Crepidotus variabilis]|uniref:Uncharacterized protein n=1 Tax=Crepidotus variabilis TaxID=179855 RepID=A0A9P6EJ22_9AGAR|nr:hypothetical protein CPB83DRAFT_850588 [Crepidotus variabilis]
MAQSPKFKPVSYAEVVKTFSDQDVQADMTNACEKLAHAMTSMVVKFDTLVKQIHTIDLLRHSSPMKPRWDAMRKDLVDHLWHFRTNAAIISGRMRLFESAVLPMVARSSEERSGRSTPNRESLQVLQSYMTISAEHAALAKSLVDANVKFSQTLLLFLHEITKNAAKHSPNGQQEMSELHKRLTEFEKHIHWLLVANRDSTTTNPSHIFFTCSKIVLSSGRAPGQSKLTRRPLLLDGDLTGVGQAYEQSDRKRNEVAHAQYTAQMRQNRTDPLATAHSMLSSFLLDTLLMTESGLSLFLSIWSRLRTDCMEVFQWLKDPKMASPIAVTCYLETRGGLYSPLSHALDVYTAGFDASPLASEKMESR